MALLPAMSMSPPSRTARIVWPLVIGVLYGLAIRLGIALKAGEVILSGSQSPLVPVKAGDNLHGSVGGLGSASVRFI